MTDIDALIAKARAWKSIPDPNDVIRLCDALTAERALSDRLAEILKLSRTSCRMDCGPALAESWSDPRVEAALTAHTEAREKPHDKGENEND